jgi:hypothetical protein
MLLPPAFARLLLLLLGLLLLLLLQTRGHMCTKCLSLGCGIAHARVIAAGWLQVANSIAVWLHLLGVYRVHSVKRLHLLGGCLKASGYGGQVNCLLLLPLLPLLLLLLCLVFEPHLVQCAG